jgi:hypothetical protein
MKKIGIAAVLFGLAAVAQTAMADNIGLTFSSIPGGAIDFKNETFYFSPATSAPNFWITDSNSLLKDSIGDFGKLSGGPFTIGAITTVGTGATAQSTAMVTGTGSLTISDGTDTLSAQLQWDEIKQQGTAGNLNDQGVVNLSNITYSGSSADLLALENSVDQTAVLSFSFTPYKSLETLKSTTSLIHTGFAGSISSLPEPGFYGVLCVALISLVGAGKVVAAKARRSQKS